MLRFVHVVSGPRVGLLLLALLALGVGGCGDGRTPLVLYSPHGRDLLTLLENAFEAEHPTIDVRWLDMGSQEVLDRLRAEAANPQADVWFGGPATLFARGVREQLLQPHRPPWAQAVPASSRDADGYYAALYRTPPVIVYNEEALSADEAPNDWDELLDARWSGRVLIRDPLASGTMRTIFGYILARAEMRGGTVDDGFAWLRQLDAQTKEYVHSPALLHQKLVRQEGVVTLWELTDILFQRQRGNPLGYRFPPSGTPVINDAIGLVANAPHPEPAMRFIDWVGTLEVLQLTAENAYRLPARDDIPPVALPDWAQEALRAMVVAEVDWARIEEQGAAWMMTWDRTVRGKGERSP
ncbi:MAG: extracellular solute-binding protein [Acidobacteriota bacterium]